MGTERTPEETPLSQRDPVVEFLKRDIDRSQLRENLRLTVEQRIEKHQRALETVRELRRAGKKLR